MRVEVATIDNALMREMTLTIDAEYGAVIDRYLGKMEHLKMQMADKQQ